MGPLNRLLPVLVVAFVATAAYGCLVWADAPPAVAPAFHPHTA